MQTMTSAYANKMLKSLEEDKALHQILKPTMNINR